MRKINSKVTILLVLLLPLVTLTGCSDAKSYYYYLNNPAQLEMDYQYCAHNPGRTLCDGIVKKYVQYHQALEKAQNISDGKLIESTVKKGYNAMQTRAIFANLDTPLDAISL